LPAPADAEQLHPGQVVYDPFLGSGTSIIAAESTGRKCYGLEVEPTYCDSVIRRYLNFSGKMPILEADGRNFDEVSAARGLSEHGQHSGFGTCQSAEHLVAPDGPAGPSLRGAALSRISHYRSQPTLAFPWNRGLAPAIGS
jgi:hypothetical protein